MKDHDEDVVPLIVNQLRIEGRAFSATNLLLVNGTPTALRALRDSPQREDIAVRLNLINRLGNEDVLDDIRKSLGQRAASGGDPELNRELYDLVSNSEEAERQLLGDRTILEHLLVAAYPPAQDFHIAGDQANAIRCLIRVDRVEGFQAALAALANPAMPERQCYPYVLTEADADAAVPLLLDCLATVRQSSVEASIGRALSRCDIDQELELRLSAEGLDDRVAACVAAGWAARDTHIEQILRQRLSDPEPDVSRAASEALSRIQRRRETKALVLCLLEAKDPSDRWMYLDSLLKFADPGDQYGQWPVEGPHVQSVLSPLQILHRRATLERRRKELANNQASADRQALD